MIVRYALIFFSLFSFGAEDLKKKPITYWKERLTTEQVRVCRQSGTERAGSGEYNKFYKDGVYVCSSCGVKLFDSKTKFDSGTGWPSYWEVGDKKNIELADDFSFFMKRTEVKCGNCGAHLGHVFDDGPKPTGKRYCINSVCLKFQPRAQKKKM